ncbi:preprotein translocase subunit YajC [Ruminococcus champanellensis]|uniref:preprotein translocase subunit YajC n=1 Tax=Ruminococcus champanellensis TaxID=1161942 RepID=UPI00266CA0EC|nr:preprotein translocase subunit YajC [Ruminococcus champanellensis]
MFTSLHTFAAEQSATSGGAYGLVGILPWVIVLVALYFIMIRPQRKKEKETIRMRSNIQIGDEILTIGGIVGIVVRKGEDTVVIETGGDRTKRRVRIEAVQENMTAQGEAAKV